MKVYIWLDLFQRKELKNNTSSNIFNMEKISFVKKYVSNEKNSNSLFQSEYMKTKKCKNKK